MIHVGSGNLVVSLFGLKFGLLWCGVIVFRWVEYNKSKGFFFVNTFLVHDCEGDASNRSVFALIPKPMQENQNKIKLQ